MILEDVKQLARDYGYGNLFNIPPSSFDREAFEAYLLRCGALTEKLTTMGLSKVNDADEKQQAELFGWLEERIMARLTAIARELQDWMNHPDNGEYTRRRKLALKKIAEMRLQSVSHANEEQAKQIRAWIASNT